MFYKKSLFLFTSLVIAASSSIHASDSSEDDNSLRGALKRQVSAAELFPNTYIYDTLSFRQEQLNVVKNLEARVDTLPKKIEKQEEIKKEYKKKVGKYKKKVEMIDENLISKLSSYKNKRDDYKEKLENINRPSAKV